MDTTHIHLLLDRIREEQHHQASVLLYIAQRQEEGLRLLRGICKLVQARPSAKERKTMTLPPGAMMTGLQYLAVLGGSIFLLMGGDLAKLAGLAKLFGLP